MLIAIPNGRPCATVDSLGTRLLTSRCFFLRTERSRGEVQLGDEGQAAPELRSRDEECSPGEPEAEVQAVDELQAANEARAA